MLYQVVVAQVPDKYVALWNSQRDEIIAGTIKYRYFSQKVPEVKPLSPSEIRRLVQEARLGESPDSIEQLVAQLVTDQYGKLPHFVTKTFICDGDKYAENSDEPEGLQIVSNGTLQLVKRIQGDYRDIVIEDATASHYHPESIDRLRTIPLIPSFQLPQWRVTSLQEIGQLTISQTENGAIQQYVVDASNGNVVEHIRKNDHSKVLKETLQRAFVTYDDGIVFPSGIVKADYKNGQLKRIDIAVVEKAQFNQSVPESSFVMDAQADTIIRDGVNDVSVRAENDTTDALDYITDHFAQINLQIREPAAKPFHWGTLFVCVNGIVLLCLAVFAWKRFGK